MHIFLEVLAVIGLILVFAIVSYLRGAYWLPRLLTLGRWPAKDADE